MCFVHKAWIAYFFSFYDERTCADNGLITDVRPGKKKINDPDPQCTAMVVDRHEEIDGPADCSKIIIF